MKKKLIDFPDVVDEWHPTKNDKDPFLLSAGSKHKVWWLGKCGHEYAMRVDSRTDPKKKCGCPYCKRYKSLDVISVTHPHLVEEWHPTKNGDKQPHNLTAGHVKHAWWLGKCGHEWQATVRNRAKKKPSGCPYCSGRSVCQETSLVYKFPEVASEWHVAKNDTTPDKIHFGTWKKYWWLGECGHEWKASVHARTRKLATGCPWCYRSRGEERINQVLTDFGLEYKQQVRFDSCRDKRPLVFDFQVGDVLIEYQGLQHFEETGYDDHAKRFIDIQRRDQIKRDWCRQNGIKLIEIPYTDYDSIEEIIKREVIHATDR